MKKRTELEALLSDVLAEEESSLGRSGLLAHTLQHARRKRQQRVLSRGGVSVALLAALGVWLWPAGQLPRESAGDSVRLVVTEALSPSDFVATRSGLTPVIGTSAGGFVVVQTQSPAPDLQSLDDQQLLTLVGRPAALVRPDTDHAELVFCNPADRDGLLSQ